MIFVDAVICVGVDFVPVDKNLIFTGAVREIQVVIPIINDTEYEKQPEMFQAHLQLLSSNVNVPVNQTPAMITIGVLQAK